MCIISENSRLSQHSMSCSQTEVSVKRGISRKIVRIQLCTVTEVAAAFNWESEAPSPCLQLTCVISLSWVRVVWQQQVRHWAGLVLLLGPMKGQAMGWGSAHTTALTGATLTSLRHLKLWGKAVVSHSGWVCMSCLCGDMEAWCEDMRWERPGKIKSLTYPSQ